MTDNGLEAGDEQPVNRAGVCDTICPQAGGHFQVTELWIAYKAKRGYSPHLC